MGQQHRKETKRRRRAAYIKRQKEIAKNSKSLAPVQLARKVVKDAPAEEAPVEEPKKAPAKKTTAAKETAAKKAPAKKPAAKKAPAKKAAETTETEA